MYKSVNQLDMYFKRFRLSAFFIVVILLHFSMSCQSDKMYIKHQKFANNSWQKSELVTFEVDIAEPKPQDIYIAVRHANYYPFANVLIGLTIETPAGETRFKAHDLIIRNPDGSFKGDGLGDIWDIDVPVFDKFPFNQKGTYKFTIENRMHLVEMKGIMSIGLVIKKSS